MRRVGILFHHPPDRVADGIAAMGWAPRQQRIQHRTQAVHVHLGGQSFCPRRLLRRHVAGGPRNPTKAGLAPLAEGARQPEVIDVGLPLEVEQDVRGLQIAVEDAPLVGVVDCPGRLGHQTRGAPGRVVTADRPLAAGHGLVQAAPFDPLHAEIRPAFRDPHFVDGHDVRMVEPCDGLRLRVQEERWRSAVSTPAWGRSALMAARRCGRSCRAL